MTEIEIAIANALVALLRVQIELDKAQIVKVLPIRTAQLLARTEIELKEALNHE